VVASPDAVESALRDGHQGPGGSRIFYEPLAGFDPDGNVLPVLAAEPPSVDNGSVARDGTSVTWKLKRGVVWHDGKPFTAHDVVFNWEYAADPATAAWTLATYREIDRVDKLDSHTVKIVFKRPHAVLGGAVLRPARHDHPQARVRESDRAFRKARSRRNYRNWRDRPLRPNLIWLVATRFLARLLVPLDS